MYRIISIYLAFLFFAVIQASSQEKGMFKLENPMTVEYLKKNIRKKSPRLILTPEIERNLRKKLNSDPLVQSFYSAIKSDADAILALPLPERVIPDKKRLLRVSSESLRRLNTLGIVYRIDKNPVILDRIDQEIKAVCNFTDWNPSHYLDVAEMSLAVALALDWTGKDLPESTVEMAEKALIEKGILPGFIWPYSDWVEKENNWNQVCHGGMIAASIVIADRDPELAAKTISRALDKMPIALDAYVPDGAYGEGPGYWNYGTIFSITASSVLESAFGTDFGIAGFPGFKESAVFRLTMVAPSGEFYNYGDNGTNLIADRGRGDHTTAWFNLGEHVNSFIWFANQTDNTLFFDPTYFKALPGDPRARGRFSGPALIWLSLYKPKNYEPLPLIWKGGGKNPVLVFRGGENNPENNPEMFYLGAKGGKAGINHGNMDAGSFIFELDGVRWSIDPGIQPYAQLEMAGFDLWSLGQNSQRYLLLTKGSHGHSTLVINDAPHNVEGYAPIIDFKDGSRGENPEASIEMTDIFRGQLKSAVRRFVKDSPRSIVIEDIIEKNDSTKMITWQMMTTAEVIPVKGGAVLKQEGKELKLEILSPEKMNFSIVSLDPPPMELDKQIENLKRIEIRVPAWVPDSSGKIVVRLKGD